MTIPKLPSFGDELLAVGGRLGGAVGNLINPDARFQEELRNLIVTNPKLRDSLIELSKDNPELAMSLLGEEPQASLSEGQISTLGTLAREQAEVGVDTGKAQLEGFEIQNEGNAVKLNAINRMGVLINSLPEDQANAVAANLIGATDPAQVATATLIASSIGEDVKAFNDSEYRNNPEKFFRDWKAGTIPTDVLSGGISSSKGIQAMIKRQSELDFMASREAIASRAKNLGPDAKLKFLQNQLSLYTTRYRDIQGISPRAALLLDGGIDISQDKRFAGLFLGDINREELELAADRLTELRVGDRGQLVSSIGELISDRAADARTKGFNKDAINLASTDIRTRLQELGLGDIEIEFDKGFLGLFGTGFKATLNGEELKSQEFRDLVASKIGEVQANQREVFQDRIDTFLGEGAVAEEEEEETPKVTLNAEEQNLVDQVKAGKGDVEQLKKSPLFTGLSKESQERILQAVK